MPLVPSFLPYGCFSVQCIRKASFTRGTDFHHSFKQQMGSTSPVMAGACTSGRTPIRALMGHPARQRQMSLRLVLTGDAQRAETALRPDWGGGLKSGLMSRILKRFLIYLYLNSFEWAGVSAGAVDDNSWCSLSPGIHALTHVKVDIQSQSPVPVIQHRVSLLQLPRAPVETRDPGLAV